MESSQPPVPLNRRKKEVFQWSTPADEFAEDVGSDVEEEDVFVEEEEDAGGSESDDDPLRHDIPVEDEEEAEAKLRKAEEKARIRHEEDAEAIHEEEEDFNVDSETGGIIINLGVEEADKFSALEAVGRKRRRKGTLVGDEGSSSASKTKHKYPCPKCNKEWSWPWELRRHIVTHYREKERQETSAYKCETCGKGFQWKRDLAQHRRLHTGEKLLICSVCQKKFTTRQALLHHVVVHTGEKPFQCAFCGNKFTQPANLRTHMKKKHSDLNVKGNKCPHCGEGFSSIVSVHQHVLVDHQNLVAEARESLELDRIRKEAEKVIKEKQKIERRRIRIKEKVMNIAHGDRPYKRVKEWEMEYEFQLGEGLVRGVDWDRTPSNGELSCDQCDRKFGWRYEVMFHGLCHLVDEDGNAKNKVCPECDTAFKVPIGLKHHLVHHTGETPFLCLHCWKSFASHIDLKLHIRKEHLLHLLPSTPGSTTTSKGGKKSKETIIKKEEDKKIHFEEIAHETDEDSGSVTVVVEDSRGSNGQTSTETETIMIGGEEISANDQDMIVIVQSGEFEDSQGLIVVDPSQIRQINGEGSKLTTTTEVHEDEKQQQQQYVKLQVSEGCDETTVVVSQEETQDEDADEDGDESTYVVVDSNNQITIQASSKRELPHKEEDGVVIEPSKRSRTEEIIISDNVHTETIIEDTKATIIEEKHEDET